MPRRLVLTGIVQGVFCRNYCRQYARIMGLGGGATNLPDGTVEVLLSTDDDSEIAEYITYLKKNPRGFRFYGSINSITATPWDGPLGGDYRF